MQINYMCYSIRKFFLIFLAITCQVGITNAGDISYKYETCLQGGKLDEILTLLQNNQESINYDTDTFINTIKTDDSKTALQLAFSHLSEASSKPLIKELLKFKKVQLYQKDKDGTIPMIHAIYHGEKEVVERLLGAHEEYMIRGQYTYTFTVKNNTKLYYYGTQTVLMYAIDLFGNNFYKESDLEFKEKLKGIIDLLMKYTRRAVKNTYDKTALSTALEKLIAWNDKKTNSNDEKEAKKFVLKSLIGIIPKLIDGTIVNLKSGTFGETPLMFAIKAKQKDIVEKLLAIDTINVDQEDRNKRTAIFYAIGNYDKDIFEKILNATKDLNHKNNENKTPLLFLLEKQFQDQSAHQEAIQKLAKKLEESSTDNLDYRPKENGFTALQYLVFTHIIEFKRIEKSKKRKINELKQGTEYNKQINDIKQKTQLEKQKLNEQYIPKVNILLNAGADATLTFKDPEDSQEKTAISMIPDDLAQENEELDTLKSSLKEAKENYRKRKEKNKDTLNKDQNQDGGNGMNIGTVVIIIAAVGSLVVGAIVAVPLLFKKQKATKEDNDQSKDNTAKPKSIST